jgi:hypothetical protein
MSMENSHKSGVRAVHPGKEGFNIIIWDPFVVLGRKTRVNG